jgi:hypothetical protein
MIYPVFSKIRMIYPGIFEKQNTLKKNDMLKFAWKMLIVIIYILIILN